MGKSRRKPWTLSSSCDRLFLQLSRRTLKKILLDAGKKEWYPENNLNVKNSRIPDFLRKKSACQRVPSIYIVVKFILCRIQKLAEC